MWIVDEIIRFFQAQTRDQYHVLKSLDKLEKSYRPEDAFDSLAMRETGETARSAILRDSAMAAALMEQSIKPDLAAARLLMSEARQRLDDDHRPIALTAKVRGLKSVERYAMQRLKG